MDRNILINPPSRIRRTDTPMDRKNSGLFSTNSYDWVVNLTGHSFTIPVVAAELELNEIAATCIGEAGKEVQLRSV